MVVATPLADLKRERVHLQRELKLKGHYAERSHIGPDVPHEGQHYEEEGNVSKQKP